MGLAHMGAPRSQKIELSPDAWVYWMKMLRLKTILNNNSLFLVSANGIQLFVRLLSTVVLTRILDPSAYGVLAIVATIQIIISLTSDLGIYSYVVRNEKFDDRDFLNEVWTIRLIRGALNSVVIFSLAPFVASYTKLPEIESVVQAASVIPFLESLTSMTFATAAREGKIKQLTISELVPAILGILSSILLCYQLDSYWGVIFAGYISTVMKIALSYYMFNNSSRELRLSWESIKNMWTFSKYILPSSMISLIIGQADKIVFSRIFSIHNLGLYNVASNLGLAPISLVSSYSSRILYPAFVRASAGSTTEISREFYQTDYLVRSIIIFLFGVFCFSSELIIGLLYDDRYIGASNYLFILSIYSSISYIVSITLDALLAIGKIRATFQSNIVRVFSLIISGLALYYYASVDYVIYALPCSIVATYLFNLGKLQVAGIFNAWGELRYWLYFACGGLLGFAASRMLASGGMTPL